MKKGKSVLSNVYWLSSSNLITKLIWIVCTLILMRELGPNGYGLFVLMLSAATLAAPFTDLGISLALTRDGARNPNIIRHYVNLVFRIKTVASLIVWLILAVIYYNTTDLGSYAQGYWGIVLVVAILGVPLLDHFHTVMTSILQIDQRLDIFSKYRIAMFVGVLLLFLWLPYLNQYKLLYVALAYFGATLLFVIFYVLKTKNFVPTQVGESPPFKEVAASGSSFLVLVLLSLALFRVDVIVISIFGSINQAGVYGAFYQGVFLFFMVASVLFSVLFPKLYRQSGDTEMLQNMYAKLLRFLNALSVCVTPVAIVNSEVIIRRLLGEQYASEHELFRVLVLLSALSFATISLNFLNVVDRIRYRIGIEFFLHALVVFIGAYAVTQFAAIGMAVVAVSSYFIAGSIAIFVLYQASIINLQVITRDFVKLLIVLVISNSIFYFDFSYWWLQPILYIAIVLLLLSIFRYWHAEDKELFEKVYLSIFHKRANEM